MVDSWVVNNIQCSPTMATTIVEGSDTKVVQQTPHDSSQALLTVEKLAVPSFSELAERERAAGFVI